MDDSNLQTFVSGDFSHSQIIKITHILQALILSPGDITKLKFVWPINMTGNSPKVM